MLCRISDTIEDEEALSPSQKRTFSDRWIGVVEGTNAPDAFAMDLAGLLTLSATPHESDLIINIPRVIHITQSFSTAQQKILQRCVNIMADGMALFQENASLNGLNDLEQFNSYCYHVAGVVGEMLTELFCDYSDEVATRKPELFALSSSFGQALQMTNILKDMWEDRNRGACWLPQSIFLAYDFDLRSLSQHHTDVRFIQGLNELIALAHGHINNALRYILLIPSHETGIRRFCLWALGMALPTLRRIYKKPTFKSGQEVKISRNTVKAIILSTSALARFDIALKSLFSYLGRNLPRHESSP